MIQILLIGGALSLFAWLEHRRPLRRAVESKLRRNLRNLSVAAISAASLQLAERPVVVPLARWVEKKRWGLLGQFSLPTWIEIPLAAILLDYTLYLWHILTHKIPFLWRFHQVHHVDLDLDASTAIRFHFGELVIAVLWRATQVAAIGVPPRALSAWQAALFASILFHHSNVRLPIGWERRLRRFIVTPRLHGIHHSIVPDETDSNWSSGLTIWDRLHGTLKLNIPQDEIVIGVAAYRDPKELTLPKILEMPFDQPRPRIYGSRVRRSSQTSG